jgi:ribosomal protein S18 acetylase RimI-like enzyme
MSAAVEYLLNSATTAQISDHLHRCDADFVPPLSYRVNINDYAQKIASKATRFEAWSAGELVGLVAAYCNDQKTRVAHITSVSVLKGWKGKSIAQTLIHKCLEHAKTAGMRQVGLEVASVNVPAINLYIKSRFVAGPVNASFVQMTLIFGGG